MVVVWWLLTICWQALRALALIRLGRQDETTSTLQEVHALHPYDEHTLQAMAMCYRDVNRRTADISRLSYDFFSLVLTLNILFHIL